MEKLDDTFFKKENTLRIFLYVLNLVLRHSRLFILPRSENEYRVKPGL